MVTPSDMAFKCFSCTCCSSAGRTNSVLYPMLSASEKAV